MTATLSPVAVRIPARREPVDDVLRRVGAGIGERRMFARVHGLAETPVLAPQERFEDLLVDAGREALGGDAVQLVLYGHTLLAQPMAYRPRFADRLRHALGLGDAAVVGVSQVACTSVLQAVELAVRHLERVPTAQAVLVLGGDQGSIDDWARVIPGVTVGGDGAAAVVVRRAGGRYRYLGGACARAPQFHRSLGMDPAQLREFGTVTADLAVRTARAAAEAAGLTLGDIDRIMPHHNNAMFWRGFSRTTGYPRERIHLDQLADLAHLFGIDGLVALEHADRAGALHPGQRVLLLALGQGAFVRAIVLQVTLGEGDDG